MKFEDIVSVIIPVYNAKKYLCDCIDSVLRQTYANLDIIIIDDGSIDGSEDIADNYIVQDNRISVIHKENGGAGSARNLGMSMAKGNYIYFLDADDILADDAIEKMYTEIIRSKTDIVTFECKLFNENNTVDSNLYVKTLSEGIYSGHIFFSECIKRGEFHPNPWLYLFSADVLKQNLFLEARAYEDTPFMYELLSRDVNISILKKILVYHRMDNNSVMRSAMSNAKLSCTIVNMKYMLNVYNNDNNASNEQLKFLQWYASVFYSRIREIKLFDEESKAIKKKFDRIVEDNKILKSNMLRLELFKLALKHPLRIM